MQSEPLYSEQQCLNGCTLTDINGVLPDNRVQRLLLSQLIALPNHSYTIYVAYHKIYLIVQLSHYLKAVKHPSLESEDKGD